MTQYKIEYRRDRSQEFSSYVTRRSLSLEELPIALLRSFFTREFGLTCGIPLLLIGAVEILSRFLSISDDLALVVHWGGALWMVAALFWILLFQFQKPLGIGCFAVEEGEEKLIGGLRMKVNWKKRTLLIAGAFVEIDHRQKGILKALFLALFRLFQEEALFEGQKLPPFRFVVFAPVHRASKKIVAHYFGGHCEMEVLPQGDHSFGKALRSLEEERQKIKERSIEFDFSLDPLDKT